MEVLTYLDLKAGDHTFLVTTIVEKADANIDANFVMFAGENPRDYFSKIIGVYESNATTYLGRELNDTYIDFAAEKDGIYPFSIVYYERGGNLSAFQFLVFFMGLALSRSEHSSTRLHTLLCPWRA